MIPRQTRAMRREAEKTGEAFPRFCKGCPDRLSCIALCPAVAEIVGLADIGDRLSVDAQPWGDIADIERHMANRHNRVVGVW